MVSCLFFGQQTLVLGANRPQKRVLREKLALVVPGVLKQAQTQRNMVSQNHISKSANILSRMSNSANKTLFLDEQTLKKGETIFPLSKYYYCDTNDRRMSKEKVLQEVMPHDELVRVTYHVT